MTTKKMHYDPIPDGDGGGGMSSPNVESSPSPNARSQRWWSNMRVFRILLVIASLALLLVLASAIASIHQSSSSSSWLRISSSSTNARNSINKGMVTTLDGTTLPVPHGVNLGSFLSLEDYFFVGADHAIEVATPFGSTAAQCLPPIHVDSTSTGPQWQSETDLYGNLRDEFGGVSYAVSAFHAYRRLYLGKFIDDVPHMVNLGIQRLRVPVSWCLTDFNPEDDEVLKRAAAGNYDDVEEEVQRAKDDDDELERRYTCPDPYHTGVRWPAVPKSLVVETLRVASKHGLTLLLDVHTVPGGNSPGTFSGVWPLPPKFWYGDDPKSPDTDLGRSLFRDFVVWCESLATDDPEAFKGLGGITPMNEPAHLAGMYEDDDDGGPIAGDRPDVVDFLPSTTFLPRLPKTLASSYLDEINHALPDGNHLRSFLWQRDAVDIFRRSKLPSLGIDCVVNIHESVFRPTALSSSSQQQQQDDASDPGGRHPHATRLIARWWKETTSTTERETWAVLDMHHYHAWEPACRGAVDGPSSSAGSDGANYTCTDEVGRADALRRCASWASSSFRRAANIEGLGPHARLASGEFSTSTHHTVRRSCTDVTTLRDSYLVQLADANEADVEMYYWSWTMPFGGAIREAWSYKRLLHRLGAGGWFGGLDGADESSFGCGGGGGSAGMNSSGKSDEESER